MIGLQSANDAELTQMYSLALELRAEAEADVVASRQEMERRALLSRTTSSARLVVEFFIAGTPVPQGSKTGFVVGKRAIITDANKAELKPWRQVIAAAAREAYDGPRIEGGVLLVVEFRMLRPKSVKRDWPTVKPDLDKLERALLDGLTDSGIWRDDSQVVSMPSKKVYAERAGVHVQLGEFATPEKREGRK